MIGHLEASRYLSWATPGQVNTQTLTEVRIAVWLIPPNACASPVLSMPDVTSGLRTLTKIAKKRLAKT